VELPGTDTATADRELVPEPPADSIHVARLSPPVAAKPPTLAFVTEAPRPQRIELRVSRRVAVGALVALVAVLCVVAVALGTSGDSKRAVHKPAVRLTPAQTRFQAAERARAEAIAQAKRDRGTDAELEDTVPPAPAPPTP
jgi:hypothetical protein